MHNLKKILIYLMFSILEFSAGMSEFPCQYPCQWQNKTFSNYKNGQVAETWTFDADGQHSRGSFGAFKCYQITEQFLIVREGGTPEIFVCFTVSYNPENPLEIIIGGFGNTNRIYVVNKTGEFTDLCRFCTPSSNTVYAFSATGSPPSPTLSLNCTRPSTCSPPGVVCNSSDTISNPCPITTEPTTAPKTETTTAPPTAPTIETTSETATDPTTASTTAPITAPTTEPTTTPADPKTKKSHCRKKHDHRSLI